jgi:hypothetical protein
MTVYVADEETKKGQRGLVKVPATTMDGLQQHFRSFRNAKIAMVEGVSPVAAVNHGYVPLQKTEEVRKLNGKLLANVMLLTCQLEKTRGLYEKVYLNEVTPESAAALYELKEAGAIEEVGLPPFTEEVPTPMPGGEGGAAPAAKPLSPITHSSEEEDEPEEPPRPAKKQSMGRFIPRRPRT